MSRVKIETKKDLINLLIEIIVHACMILIVIIGIDCLYWCLKYFVKKIGYNVLIIFWKPWIYLAFAQ